MPDPKEPMTTPDFKVGDQVRVKPGVTDPDFPDMPLGGWAGTVTGVIEQQGQFNCVFKLDDRTLATLHPIFLRRSEIEGLDYKFMGLGQEDIEWDDGVPVPIEQPLAIVPRPLAMDDQDDRVRMAFGLTHDDFLPEVNGENHVRGYPGINSAEKGVSVVVGIVNMMVKPYKMSHMLGHSWVECFRHSLPARAVFFWMERLRKMGTGSSEGRAVPVPFFRLDPSDTVKRKPL